MENIFQTKRVKSESVENLENSLPNADSDQIRSELGTQPLRIVEVDSPQRSNCTRTGPKSGMDTVNSERGVLRPSRPSRLCQTSTGQGADGVFSHALPTEKDIKEMQSIQCKRRSKKSMNAFLVWVWIQRKVLKKVFSGRGAANICAQLGCEWSKLTEEQKKPFYKASYKLKKTHEDQFPEYQDRKQTEFNLEQKAGQLSEQQQSSNVPTFVSQVPPVTQPELLGTFMYQSPMVLHHSVGCPLFFNPCHPVILGFMDQNHFSRTLFACNSMEGVQNPSYSHPQSEVFNFSAASEGTMLFQHCSGYTSQESLMG